jgi:hypothetical protein
MTSSASRGSTAIEGMVGALFAKLPAAPKATAPVGR